MALRPYYLTISEISFDAIKQQEAQRRLAALKRSQRSQAAASAQQKRASLVGDASKCRITHLKDAVRAMASWR